MAGGGGGGAGFQGESPTPFLMVLKIYSRITMFLPISRENHISSKKMVKIWSKTPICVWEIDVLYHRVIFSVVHFICTLLLQSSAWEMSEYCWESVPQIFTFERRESGKD